MTSGRNQPCPCGSGKKYKRCCLASGIAMRFTAADRQSAFAKLERLTELLEDEENDAYDELWGADAADADELDEQQTRMSQDVLDLWFCFDRPLADGSLVVDRLLAADTTVTAAERRFLTLLKAASMRLYEVEDSRPGVSLTLRDLLTGTSVTVREKLGSRTLGRADLLAARIIPTGVSGEPEIEAGLLPLARLQRRAIVTQLEEQLREFRDQHPLESDTAFYKELPPFFHDAWTTALLDAPIPRLQNTDGEDLVLLRIQYEVPDPDGLGAALDAAATLERDGAATKWLWIGANRKNEPTILGWLKLDGSTLVLETNSLNRGERGRALVETIAGDRARYRSTTCEDPTASVREALRSGRENPAPSEPSEPEGLPAGVVEDLTLDHMGRHYRAWLDDSIPALGGRTPREAARDANLVPKVSELIRGLEGMYQTALRRQEPAYDPSWMWAELGLAPGPDVSHPPPLARERMAEASAGMGEVSQKVAEHRRQESDFDDASSIVEPRALAGDLDARRFLADAERSLRDAGLAEAALADHLEQLHSHLVCMANFELHRRKTFWVDEALVYMLAHTELDVIGAELRVPFPSFALVFTDRHVLSLVERLLAGRAGCPLAGHFLRVLTVYVTEVGEAAAERVLHLGFAADALGADPPYLVRHDLPVHPGARVAAPPPPEVVVENSEPRPLPRQRPLERLVQVTLNAILYATSAGMEPEVRRSPPRPSSPGTARPTPTFSAEDVFYLPGAIDISQVRRWQELERAPGGRQILHRFLVRGHWRRAARSFRDQRLRWIEPYWKGPDMAAVIERAYKLNP